MNRKDAEDVLTHLWENLPKDMTQNIKIIGSLEKKFHSDHDIDVLIDLREFFARKYCVPIENVEVTDWGGYYIRGTVLGDVDIFSARRDYGSRRESKKRGRSEMKKALKPRFDHCCGLSGFGQSLYDICLACHFNHLTREGMSEDEAEIRTKIEREKSAMVLFPRFKKHCEKITVGLGEQLKNLLGNSQMGVTNKTEWECDVCKDTEITDVRTVPKSWLAFQQTRAVGETIARVLCEKCVFSIEQSLDKQKKETCT